MDRLISSPCMVLLVHIKKNITPNILAQLFNFWIFYCTHADLYSTFPLNFLQIARNFFLAVDSYTTQLNLKVKYMYMYVSKEVMTLLFFRPRSFKCFMQTREGKCSWGSIHLLRGTFLNRNCMVVNLFQEDFTMR